MLTNNNFEINETVQSVANYMLDYLKRAAADQFDAIGIIDGMVEEYNDAKFFKQQNEIECTDEELILFLCQHDYAITAEVENDEQYVKPAVIRLNDEQTVFMRNLLHKLSLDYFENFNFDLQQFINAVNSPVE